MPNFASHLQTGPKLDPLAIVFSNGGEKVRCCFRSVGNLLSGDQCLTERSSPVLKLVSVSCWRRTLSCPTLSLCEQNSLRALFQFSIQHTWTKLLNNVCNNGKSWDCCHITFAHNTRWNVFFGFCASHKSHLGATRYFSEVFNFATWYFRTKCVKFKRRILLE